MPLQSEVIIAVIWNIVCHCT